MLAFRHDLKPSAKATTVAPRIPGTSRPLPRKLMPAPVPNSRPDQRRSLACAHSPARARAAPAICGKSGRIMCAGSSRPMQDRHNRMAMRPCPAPQARREAAATPTSVNAMKTTAARRAPSWIGSHGEARLAVSTATKWNSGGFSMKGSPPTCGTTQSPLRIISSMLPKT